MDIKKIFHEIKEHIEEVVGHLSPLGQSLWKELLKMHPADLAQCLTDLDNDSRKRLFIKLPKTIKLEVFEEFSDVMKVRTLAHMEEVEIVEALNVLTADELTDLFDLFSDDELKKYLGMLHQKARQEVIALLKFHPESAGGIMDIHVLTLMQDFTVEKSIKILQRLRPRREVHQQIYVTDNHHRLVGHILLEDLVMQQPQKRMSEFMREDEFIAQADEDREDIARRMVHYGLMSIPVVGENNHFLGVISSETLVDVIVEEASEDVQKMAALTPMKHSYFETSFWKMLYERTYILVPLLLAESFTRFILNAYETSISLEHRVFLLSFIPMLISTGGNTSNQTSALVIQGMAAGDIHSENKYRFLRKEFLMAFLLATILGFVSFLRVYMVSSGSVLHAVTVSMTLFSTVLVSVMLAGVIPFGLKRLNIDPAFSAGPFLATLMDILGVLILCQLSKVILS